MFWSNFDQNEVFASVFWIGYAEGISDSPKRLEIRNGARKRADGWSEGFAAVHLHETLFGLFIIRAHGKLTSRSVQRHPVENWAIRKDLVLDTQIELLVHFLNFDDFAKAVQARSYEH